MPDQVVSPVIPSVSASPNGSSNILDILIAEHALTPAQGNEIRVKSAQSGIPIEKVLDDANLVAEDKIAEAKAKILGIPYISLVSTSFSPQALSHLPRAVVDRFQLIPFYFDEKNQYPLNCNG